MFSVLTQHLPEIFMEFPKEISPKDFPQRFLLKIAINYFVLSISPGL